MAKTHSTPIMIGSALMRSPLAILELIEPIRFLVSTLMLRDRNDACQREGQRFSMKGRAQVRTSKFQGVSKTATPQPRLGLVALCTYFLNPFAHQRDRLARLDRFSLEVTPANWRHSLLGMERIRMSFPSAVS